MPFWLITSLVLGMVIGSFLNVVILRLPVIMDRQWRRDCHEYLEIEANDVEQKPFNIIFPPSNCPHCGHQIRPWENIPLISYLFLRGSCAECSARISPRYPIIETVCGLITVFVVWHFGLTLLTLAVLVFSWSLIVLTVIDIDHQLLPDNITVPLLWLGLLINSQGMIVPLHDALWGAMAGYLVLWSVYWLFKLVTGKEGMGFGDFKLLAALGAWMGWQALPTIIILSSFVGAALGIGMILLRGRDRNLPMPFGPFLAIAGWLTLFWGDAMMSVFLR